MATEIFVKIILDSISPEGKRLTAMHWHYPRFIHSEVMTHRDFSRNARSSRAVPGQTLIAELMNGAAVSPLHWGAAQKGMQADNETDASIKDWWLGEGTLDNVNAWAQAATQAISAAEAFMNAGYHKQVYNRLLEPFLHIDTLISTTEINNFLWLRDHKDAEPHIAILARKVKEALDASTPKLLHPGEWHLPYITPEDWELAWKYLGRDTHGSGAATTLMKQVSAARCARISYKPFDGNGSFEAELNRYNQLISSQPMHASPVEHQATPDTRSIYQVRKRVDQGEESVWRLVSDGWDYDNPQLHGNFKGWVQFRKTLAGERRL